jgi:hypothetical protein
VEVVDFDADGRSDVVLIDDDSYAVHVLFGGDHQPFVRRTRLPTPTGAPRGAATGDFDGDGDLDLFVSLAEFEGVSTLRVFENRGADGFVPTATIEIGQGINRFDVRDLDGDGVLDFIASAQPLESVRLLWGETGEERLFRQAEGVPVEGFVAALASADWTGDGVTDLCAYIAEPDRLSLLSVWDGDWREIVTTPTPTAVREFSSGDLDGDGDPDLVALSGVAPYAWVLLVDPVDGFTRREIAFLPGPALGAAITDVDGDLLGDLILTAWPDKDVFIARGRGNGSFETPRRIPFTTNPATVVSADLDGNGVLDLAALLVDGNDSEIAITDGILVLGFLFTGSGTIAPPGPAGESCGRDPDVPGSPGDLGCDAYAPCADAGA